MPPPLLAQTSDGGFRVLLLCCVFTPVPLLQNQNYHVTWKLGFRSYNVFQLIYLVGTGSVALLLTLRETFIDPTAGKFAEAKDIKRVQRVAHSELFTAARKYVLFWEKKYAGGVCAITQMGFSEPDDSHSFAVWSLNIQVFYLFIYFFLQAAHSSNENTSTKRHRGQPIQHPG